MQTLHIATSEMVRRQPFCGLRGPIGASTLPAYGTASNSTASNSSVSNGAVIDEVPPS